MSFRTYILLYFCLSLCATAISQDKKALHFFENGKKEFSERKYAAALENFEKYFERDSSKVEAYFRTAQIYEAFKNTNQASYFYKKVILKDSISAAFSQAYTYLGTRALENHDFEIAKMYLTRSLAKTNKNSILYAQLQKQLKTCEFGIQAMQNPMDIRPEPLSKTINFKSQQYFPVITADNTTLFFTAREPNEDENIYISSYTNQTWKAPKSISNTINTPFNEGTCSISADGKIMVFTSCEGRESFGSCDLFITKKIGENWLKPENLGKKVNSRYWDSQPSLSSDGSKLFFSSDRPLGIGRKDIWMSQLDETGEWKEAVNLGPKINTSLEEVSPFIHANGYSLFFSSNGWPGMGSHDLFLTNLKNDVDQKVVNLGYPINTFHDELSLFISADGKNAYYSIDDNKKVMLYQFSIPTELNEKIEKTHYLKGYVMDKKTKKPLLATIELIDLTTEKKISKFSSDPITGDYMAILPNKGSFALYAEVESYLFKSLNFDFQENRQLDIEMIKIEKESSDVLENIFFDKGSATLRPESAFEIKKLVALLVKNPTLKVEISGHTDDIGQDATNLELSKKRALAVVKYLHENGIPNSRASAIGKGETQPKAKNDNETNRQKNRRIEMRLF
jgi:outer membrane protein OmpA-like peptidoglycan-associated protein